MNNKSHEDAVMKRLLLLTFFIVYAHAQEELTAEDAIRVGLENNYTIQIARNNQKIAENNTGIGRANFMPYLDASGAHRYTKSDVESDASAMPGDSETRSTSGQIALTWTLFDGCRMFVDHSRYQELAKLGKYQARFIIENTVIDILYAYFNLVQQVQLLDVARDALAVSETRLNKEQVRKDLGSASSTDFLDAQVAYNTDKSVFINQELQVAISRQNLNVLLARDPASDITVKKEIQISAPLRSFQEIQQLVNEQNSQLLVYRQNRTVAQKYVTMNRSAFYPHVTFSSTYGYLDRKDIPAAAGLQQTDLLIGLNLTFNLFNGWRDRIDVQNAEIEAKNQELALQDIINRVNQSLLEKYETFQKRLQLVEIEEKNVRAAEQNLRLQSDRYQLGSASSLEFRDAQVNVVRARSTLIVVKFQARISRLEIDQLTGQIAVD
jgi:outer membrane protein